MTAQPSTAIIGADRLRGLTQLCSLWDESSASGPCRLVVVRGGTGSGRTTMLQSLYRHCAMRDARPRYWPADLVENKADDTISISTAALPALFPDPVTPEPGSQLGFFWWGLRGMPDKCAAQEGQPQLVNHLDALASAVTKADQLVRDRLVAAMHALCLFASILPVGAPLAAAFNAVAAMKDAEDVDRRIGRGLRTSRGLIDEARTMSAGREISVGTLGAAVAAAEANARQMALVAGIVPFAVVVDDAERLDTVSIAMLKVILRDSSSRGIIVLAINSDVPTDTLGARPGESGKALDDWLNEETQAGNIFTVDLQPLTSTELTEVGIQYLERRGRAAVDGKALNELISSSHGSPGRLISLLRVPAVIQALEGFGGLPADLKPLSSDAVVEDAFHALPPSERCTLATVSLAGPAVPERWMTEILVGAGTAQPLWRKGGADSSGWLKIDQGGILRFSSPSALAVASRSVARELTPDQQRHFFSELSSRVDSAKLDESWASIPAGVCESLLSALIGFPHTAPASGSMKAWEAELIRIRRVTGRVGAEEAALRQLEERLHGGTPSAVLVVATAEALMDAGYAQRALDVLTKEHDRLTAKFGLNAPQTLPALSNLAAFWAASARESHGRPEAGGLYDYAITLYRHLLQGRQAHLAKHHIRIIHARGLLARLLADAYRYSEAIDEINVWLKEAALHPELGHQHPDVLSTRSQLAFCIGYSGQPARARDLFWELLPDMSKFLGIDHPDTLAARNDHAFWTGSAGDMQQAQLLLLRLLPDRLRIMGPDHPETLALRGDLAACELNIGDAAKARKLFADLLEDEVRILGPDHPHTLKTLSNVASTIGESDSAIAARDSFQSLLATQIKVLGPDHLNTLSTRSNLASWTGETGDHEGARDMAAELVLDTERVLGPDHPDTLQIRQIHAHWTGIAGDAQEARDLVAKLLPRWVSVFGVDDPSTLVCREELALWIGKNGDAAGAQTLMKELASDADRLFGPSAPKTLRIREVLKYWSNMAK